MAEKKKNFYAVVKGRRPGIYTQWSGAGGAEEQIKGYPGAVFRGFATREEAEYYLRTGGKVQPAPPALIRGGPGPVPNHRLPNSRPITSPTWLPARW